MTDQEIRRIFEETGSILTDGHFVYTKGGHGSAYVTKDAIYPYVRKIDKLCRAMAGPFCILERVVETVIGPALGGITLSQRVASHLSDLQGNEVMSVFAEKEGDMLAIKRDQLQHVVGKRVLVVEDTLNTGGSAKAVVDLVRAAEGKVVGVSALCNRGGVTKEDLGVSRLHALMSIDLEVHEETKCPLCMQGVPINTKFGHGKKFLEDKGV